MNGLRGRRVLLLRPEGRSVSLRALLEERGALVTAIDGVEILPAADPSVIDAALADAATFEWGVFTSVSGVRAVLARGISLTFPLIAAVGPATADAIVDRDVWLPGAFTTAALGSELPGPSSACLFRAESAGTGLEDTLTSRGFTVLRVNAYRSRPASPSVIAAALVDPPDAVVLTSALIARAFAAAGSSAGPLICSIGPATSEAARSAGLTVRTEARTQTPEGIVQALDEAFAGGS